MATDVTVEIDDRAIITALNTPGGGVYRWRDMIGREVADTAMVTSPVNDVQNARHRESVVGIFKASWGWDSVGSNGHRVRATIYNAADYAVYVEEGRSASLRAQRFSWTGFGGDIRTVFKTRPRAGKHILRKALVAVMGSQGLGT
jgi:hypothetical protein